MYFSTKQAQSTLDSTENPVCSLRFLILLHFFSSLNWCCISPLHCSPCWSWLLHSAWAWGSWKEIMNTQQAEPLTDDAIRRWSHTGLPHTVFRISRGCKPIIVLTKSLTWLSWCRLSLAISMFILNWLPWVVQMLLTCTIAWYLYGAWWRLPGWPCWRCGGPGTELHPPALWGPRPADSVAPLRWWLSWAHWAAAPSPPRRCPGWWYRCLHQSTWRRQRGGRVREEWQSESESEKSKRTPLERSGTVQAGVVDRVRPKVA